MYAIRVEAIIRPQSEILLRVAIRLSNGWVLEECATFLGKVHLDYVRILQSNSHASNQ